MKRERRKSQSELTDIRYMKQVTTFIHKNLLYENSFLIITMEKKMTMETKTSKNSSLHSSVHGLSLSNLVTSTQLNP